MKVYCKGFIAILIANFFIKFFSPRYFRDSSIPHSH